MENRAKLLNEIDEVIFALRETVLFLETHPEDRQVLAYFNKLMPRKKELMREFAEAFEPLAVDCICGEEQKRGKHGI